MKKDPKKYGWEDEDIEILDAIEEGGPGSGNFGHAGRPGQVGGSAPADAGAQAGEEPPAGLHMKYAFKYNVSQSWYRDERKQKMYSNKINKIVGQLPTEDTDGLSKVTCVDPGTIDKALGTEDGQYATKAAAVYEDTEAQIFVNLPFFGAVNVTHEVGHHVWYKKLSDTDKQEWTDYYRRVVWEGNKDRKVQAPSYYAKKDKFELFAEAYAHYHASPATRAKLDMNLRAWFVDYYRRMGIKLKHDEQLREYAAERSHTEFYRKVGNFEVWIVNGDYVRAGLDSEFGSVGQPERFSFIPKYEMWIDGRCRPEDREFLVDHLVLEQRLMARKLGYLEAVEAAERLARSERKRAGRLHSSGEARPVSDDIYVEELIEEGDCRVVLVDGAKVRKLHDSDFTGSGNDYVYARFIPAGEVWIDDRELTEDIDFRIIHELWERSLLAEGKSYVEAHREALAVEEDARIRLDERDWWLKQAIIKNLNEGGPGSGYFGHAGRPGLVGGSAPPDEATLATDKFSKDKIAGRVTVLGKRVRPEDELNSRKKFAYEEVTSDMKRIPQQDLIGLKRLHVVTRQTLVNMERNRNPYLSEDQAASAGIFRMANRTIYVQEDYVGPRNTTVLHEVGHSVEMRIWGWSGLGAGEERINRDTSLSDERKKLANDWSKLYEEGAHFPTQYSKTNRAEFFAECYARFWKNQQTRDELSGPVQDWFKRFYKSRKLSSDFQPEYRYAGVHESLAEGGTGSGHHGHAGRPGEVGGSAPSGSGGGVRDFGGFEGYGLYPDAETHKVPMTAKGKEADDFGYTLNTHPDAKEFIVPGGSESAMELEQYSGEYYDIINRYLRTGGKIDYDDAEDVGLDGSERDIEDRVNRMIDEIDGFMVNKIPENVIVYRGSASIKRLGILEPGNVFTDNAYVSTSLNSKIAEDFTGNDEYIFHIKVPKGTHAVYLGNEFSSVAEWELLLNRGTTFKVIEREGNVVKLEVVPYGTKGTKPKGGGQSKDDEARSRKSKFTWAFDDVTFAGEKREGGPGSGFFGHAGRPGEVGGSAPGEGGGLHFKLTANSKKVEGELAKKWPTYAGHRVSETDYKRLETGVPEKVANRWMRGNDPEWEAEMERNPIAALGPRAIDRPKGVHIELEENRQGRCYELACRFVMDNEDWTLVHATLYPRTGPFEDYPYFHGFAVKGETVYDAVLDKFFNKKDYYLYFTPSDERTYNNIEMSKLMLKHKTYGSWE